MQGGRWIGFWWEWIFLGERRMNRLLAGGERTLPHSPHPHSHPPSSSTSRENLDLHSCLRCFQFQDNLYIMFVILDIKFLVANIKWNLLISTGYYLLNWALESVCSCSEKSWILFTVSTCTAVVHSFQNLIWTATTLLFTATRFFACVHVRYDSISCYLNWILVLIFTKKISFSPES